MDIVFWIFIVILTLNEACAQSKSNKTLGSCRVSEMEGFIIGGKKTTIEKYPHAVCLFQSPINVYFCGASVVTQNVLVTAAHCLEGDRSSNYDAYAGHEDVERVTIIRRIVHYVIHKGYDIEWLNNDIALLFTKEPLPLGGDVHIKRIIIPSKYPFEIQQAEITGWGFTEEDGKMSTVLKVVKQDIIPQAECLRQYPEELAPGMMCAGDPKSNTNTPFKGDSGGGLITKNYQLIGVVSFTTIESTGLVVYTNLSFYHDWILEQMREITCSAGFNA